MVGWIRSIRPCSGKDFQSTLGLIAYAAILFTAAGRLDWLWGWVWLAVLLMYMTAHPILLARRDPALLAERSQGLRGPGVKGWDRWLVGASGIMMIAPWIVAGLDLRLGWNGRTFRLPHTLLGCMCSPLQDTTVFLWAMASNPFFSEGVRIQTDRGHSVSPDGAIPLHTPSRVCWRNPGRPCRTFPAGIDPCPDPGPGLRGALHPSNCA